MLQILGVFVDKRPLKVLRRFDEVESAGTEISYRCVLCHGCADCKNGERIGCISIQEEVGQMIIKHSVVVDITLGQTSAKLAFLCDPTKKHTPNRHIAKRVYDGQLKKLSANSEDTIRLNEGHWCYQLYLWDNDLNQEREPTVKVIKTLIYAINSSGKQA